MRKLVLLILLLAFAMQGCKKMDPMTDLDSVIVSAEDFIAEAEDFGSQTKTSLASPRKVVWSEEDQIAIFQGSSLADRFQVSDQSVGNSNGVFSFVGNPGVENGDYSAGTETTLETNVALYPYQDGIECSAITDEEDVVTSYTITGVTIPANQIYAEDSFADESFIMAAVTRGVADHNLKFKNVCGAIKLQLKGDRTIKSIFVAGKGDEVIAGEGVVTVYTDGAAPSVLMDESGEKVITLDCSEDGGVVLSQEEATVFVIAVPPTPFESGFTVTITDVDDNAETFSASAGTSVERSVITVMPEIDLDEEEEITTSAYLPDGETFNSTVDAFMTGKGITEIKFITNSATTSEDALVDGCIYLVQNGQTLEIHTAASQFVANSSCSYMFAGNSYDDNLSKWVDRTFKQIKNIDFGENFNTENVTDMGDMFADCSNLTSLDVSRFDTRKVTIMYTVFYNCSSLSSLDVSNFNTQNVTSMSSMFNGCSKLASLDVSNFNTQNVKSMYKMFQKCSSLSSLDLSNFDTQNVTNIRWMFEGCSSLTLLDLRNFDTQKVTTISGMFYDCSSLTSLDVSNFDTHNVTDMTEMFRGCRSLTSLDVSNFDTQNVTDMFGMFSDCSSLTSLDLSSFSILNNPLITNMFYNTGSNSQNKPINIYVTPNTKSYIEWIDSDEKDDNNSNIDNNNATLVVIDEDESLEYALLPTGPEFNTIVDEYISKTSGITKIKFIAKSNIKSSNQLTHNIYLIQNGETLEIHTAADQFVANNDCSLMFTGYKYEDNTLYIGVCDSFSNIESIDFGDNFNTHNVTDMSDMFSGCSALTSLDVTKFNTENVTSMFSMFSGCSALASLDVRNFDTKNVWTMYCMFELCRSLTSLDVTNFNTKKVSNMTRLFGGCSGLTSLDVANFNTENVTGMSGMFENCINLTSLDITNFNTENVTNMTGMFNGCKGLVSLDLSNFNTRKVTGMSSMFSGCSNLTSLDLSNFDTHNVTDMRYMFEDCSSLTLLDLSNFDTRNVTNMGWMFSGCTSLTSLDVSNFNTQNVTSIGGMFQYCSSLTSLDVSNFDTQNVTDMGVMFESCSNLTSLDVSNFNTQNVTYMNYMFSHCSKLTSLDVSNFDTQNVTDMSDMFGNCSNLTSLNLSNLDTQNVTNMSYMFNNCRSLTSLDLSNFTFEGNPDIEYMFYYTGSNATNKPIPIYVSAEWKSYIETKGNSHISSNYATLTIKSPQGE